VTVSIGVVGCGWWSTTAHLPAVAQDPRARLAAIADPDEGRRTRAVARFGVERAYADWRELLDAVPLDALVVATPPAHHFAPAAAALERGIHVLVEKPMVVDPADGRRLLALVHQHGAELLVGYTFEHTRHAIQLREQIAAGRIGAVEHVSCTFASVARELYRGRPDAYVDGSIGYAMTETPHASTYSTPGAGGGQAHAQLTHSAALALHLCGLAPLRVSAFTAAFELPVDLADVLVVQFEGGAIGALDSTGAVQPGQAEILQCRIYGDAGHVQVDATQGRASIHGAGGAIEQLEPLSEAERYATGAPVRNLIGVARGEEANHAPGALGQQVVELLDAALRSAREGRVIDIAEAGPAAAERRSDH
jgi:predicted dehydrogenase